MKISNTLWGISLTVMMYAILTTLGYQVITNEDLKLSIFIGTFGTFIGRFLLAKALEGVEADFNVYRETLTIAVLITATHLIYG